MYVMSPTGISQFRDCPRKFFEQYINKSIPWKTTPAVARGNAVHASIEQAIGEGMETVSGWPEGLVMSYVENKVEMLRKVKACGVEILVEHELTVTDKLKPAEAGWWDNNAWLRARADVVLKPKSDTALVVDIKTGKKWASDHLQLRLEALLIHLVHKYPKVDWAYWYVDQGETEAGTCDFSNGLDDVEDIIQIIRNLQIARSQNQFLPKKNRFCSWCPLKGTPKCGV